MFKKLLAQKNPVIPNEEIRIAVENILIKSGKYWNSAANSMPAYFGNDAQEAKKAYDSAIKFYHLMQNTLGQIVDVWPEGFALVKEWQEIVSLGMETAENNYENWKYIRTVNIENPEFVIKCREFVVRRHQLADMIDRKQAQIQKMLIASKIIKE